MDGMDQSTCKLPNYKRCTKDNSNLMDTKITGIKVPGVGQYFYFSTGAFLKSGSNLNIECIHRCLIDVRKVYNEGISNGTLEKWPDVLYLQVDGGSENKNRYLAAYCDRLVALGTFLKVKMNFLMWVIHPKTLIRFSMSFLVH